MKISRFLVTATDYDENGNRSTKPRLLGVFNLEEDAYAFMLDDMHDYIDSHTDDEGNCKFILDDVKYDIHDEGYLNGCDYSVMPVEIELTDAEKRKCADELIGDLPF